MSRVQTRKNVSVRGTTYDYLRKYCASINQSMSDFVETAIADHLIALGQPPQAPSTYKWHKPAPRPLRMPNVGMIQVETTSGVDAMKVEAGDAIKVKVGDDGKLQVNVRPPFTRKPKPSLLNFKRLKESKKAGGPSDDELAEAEAEEADEERPTPLRFRAPAGFSRRQPTTKPPQAGKDDPARSGRGASKPTAAGVVRSDQPTNVKVF